MSSPAQIAGAQIHGVASGFAHLGNRTEDEAVAEIQDILNRCATATIRHDALVYTASALLVQSHAGYWHPKALALLEHFGVDMAAAQTMARRPRPDLGRLGEQHRFQTRSDGATGSAGSGSMPLR